MVYYILSTYIYILWYTPLIWLLCFIYTILIYTIPILSHPPKRSHHFPNPGGPPPWAAAEFAGLRHGVAGALSHFPTFSRGPSCADQRKP